MNKIRTRKPSYQAAADLRHGPQS